MVIEQHVHKVLPGGLLKSFKRLFKAPLKDRQSDCRVDKLTLSAKRLSKIWLMFKTNQAKGSMTVLDSENLMNRMVVKKETVLINDRNSGK